MTTYKFLARGAVGPMSGFKWPEPQAPAFGAWVDAEGSLELCVRGAHVCRAVDLAYWLHDELWETQVDGEQMEGIDCLVVRRARLVGRIDAWQKGGATGFAEACAEHAAELAARPALPGAARSDRAQEFVRAYIDDARFAARSGYVAVSAFAAALAVGKLGEPSDEEAAYRRERLWQADWIARVVVSS
ncbi:MAG TPA: hypothetical protein VK540_13415 [Polyangiaceae bacterium]|nr:hypothetical protein [Polyangiaceae bacterium]